MNQRTKDEQREICKKGGIASGEARKKKKSMRDAAKMLMDMNPTDNLKEGLRKMGVTSEEDQSYGMAVVARLVQKAVADADTSAIRLLGELTGDINRFTFGGDDDEDVIDMQYPYIAIPDNGRDRKNKNELAPQAGPQTMFMMSSADIIVYGGAAGGGKTYALLLEGLRHKDVKGFGSVIFRHNYNQITAEGGLWDASNKLYSQVPDAQPRKSPKLHWKFTGGAKLNFAHIEREEDLQSWQGTEIAYIGFDELTHFTKHQFLYMLSRNRTTCGVRPYVRATCNPDADSWVAELISWWIDQDTGYAIPERSGQIRWMSTINDVIYFHATWEESYQHALEMGIAEEDALIMPKSFTFVASSLEDNKILMETDPGYKANLMAMTEVDRERLLKGNWKIKPAAGSFFKRTQVGEMLSQVPNDLVAVCRGWDLAATDKDEDDDAAFTAGVLIGRRSNGRFVVLDVINKQIKAGEVRTLVKMTAQIDASKYSFVRQRLPQDPGQAGKEQAQSYIEMLAGYDVVTKAESGDKATRAEPMAAQWQHNMFDVVIGEWNEMYFNQLESFPDSKFKDMVDAGSSAFNEITLGMGFNIDNLL